MTAMRREITWTEYKALREAREKAEEAKEWDKFRELDDTLDEVACIPEAGCIGTVHYYNDCCSGHVEKMLSPRRLLFVETGIFSSKIVFTKRKNGRWVQEGERIGSGLSLTLGWAHDYLCPEV